MSYRDAAEALREYRRRLVSDLDEARRAAREAAEQAAKASLLERELSETDTLLAKMDRGRRHPLPMLDDVKVAAPCTASWDEMVGSDHVRFCNHCEKSVYNLSSLPRQEAEALLIAREGSLCVRFYQRADGTVLTADCPVGVRKRRRRRFAYGAIGAGLMATGTFGLAGFAMMGARAPTSDPLVAATTRHGVVRCPGWRPPNRHLRFTAAGGPSPTR